ncbi:putative transcription factor C2H2 family [Helianthus annuus]|nr:putative transcription factor C2H2 family [Helianthus annuus]
MSDDSTATCSQCNLTHPKILHHIRLNATFRRLCTTCVLRLHPNHFCPSCLTVYHRSPPENAIVCFKCHSFSHRTCVSPSVTVRTPCATCLNPNGVVFSPRSSSWIYNSNNGSRRIDLAAARLLVAAAEISTVSMSRAEAAAVKEAEWRAKEASEWGKKAKEAVNHVVKVREIEKKKRDDECECECECSVVVDDVGSNSSFVGIGSSVGSVEAFEALKLAGESG